MDSSEEPIREVTPPESAPPEAAGPEEVPTTWRFTPVPCEAPERRAEARFDRTELTGEPVGEDGFRLAGGGLVVADLNGDGRMDVFAPGVRTSRLYLQSEAGAFVDVAETWLAGVPLTGSTAASAADVDGDGDLDLFVARWQQVNRLLRNDGDRFTDVTERAGWASATRSVSSAWGDLDQDGDLDLFVGGYGPKPSEVFGDSESFEVSDPSEVWENLGDGRFADRSAMLPQALHDSHTFHGGWLDVDLDGDLDLYVLNDFGWMRPSRLLWNDSGELVADAATTGLEAPFAGMGLGVGDVNGDEVPDMLQTSWRDTSLLVSQRGHWFEEAAARGLQPDWEGPARQIFGWGAALADMDVDGDLDGVIGHGYWDDYAEVRRQVDGLWIQRADGRFVDRAVSWGQADAGATRGLVVADVNADGWPDIVKRSLDGPVWVDRSRCGAEAWLSVRLHGVGLNTHAVGARVRVLAGDAVWTRSVEAGSTSMFSGGPPEVLFGLGALDAVDHVEVVWPDGQVTRWDSVSTRQRVHVARDVAGHSADE